MIDFEIVPMETWWHLEYSINVARVAIPPEIFKNKETFDLRADIKDRGSKHFVALVNGGVKGFTGLKQSGMHSKVYEFTWCVIHPEYQKYGLGKALTNKRIEYVKEQGGKVIFVTTPHLDYFRKFGFEYAANIDGSWANYLMVMKL